MSYYQFSVGFLEIFTMLWKTISLLGFVLFVLGKEHATSEQRFKIIHKGKGSQHVKLSHIGSKEKEGQKGKLTQISSKENDGQHGQLSHIGSKKPEHHEEYASSYPSYEFSYKVHDSHTDDVKEHEESREGDMVKGEYWLIQPDGRKRIVKYNADKHSGFHASVKYSDDKHKHEDKKEEEGGEGEGGDEEGSEGEGGEGEGGEQEGDEEEKANEEESEEQKEDRYSKKSKKAESESKDKGKKSKKVEGGGKNKGKKSKAAEDEGGNEDASEEENEDVSEEEEDEGRDAEESRGQEELGKWINSRYWGYHGDKNRQRNKYDHRDDGRYYNEYSSLEGRKHKANKNSYRIPIITKLGNYGDRQENYNWQDYEKHQEERARPAYRKQYEQRPYSEQKNRATVRENYVQPRIYSH